MIKKYEKGQGQLSADLFSIFKPEFTLHILLAKEVNTKE